MALALLHSPAHITAQLLVDVGLAAALGGAGAWAAFVGSEPDQGVSDNVITVYNLDPQADARSQIDGTTWQHWRLQVRVRATTPVAGWEKAEAVRTGLNDRATVYDRTVAIDAYRYLVHSYHAPQVLDIGKNVPGTKRSILTIDAKCTIRRLA